MKPKPGAAEDNNFISCEDEMGAASALRSENERLYTENDRLDELRFRIHPKDSDLSETWQEAYEVKVRDEQTLRSELQAAHNQLAAAQQLRDCHGARIDNALENLRGFLVGRGLNGGATLENHYSELCKYASKLEGQVREKDARISDLEHANNSWAYADEQNKQAIAASQREVDAAVDLLERAAKIDKRSINLAEQWGALLPEIAAFLEKEKYEQTG